MRSKVKAAFLLVGLILSGCAALLGVTPSSTAGHQRPMLRSELYFAAVAPASWQAFLAKEITPRFPDGLTWLDVNGQWRGPSGVEEKLPSRLVIVLYADNPGNRQALTDINRVFRERFGFSVLQVTTSVIATDPDWTEQRVRNNLQLTPEG